MTRVVKKVHFPTTRLAKLAARPGGVARDQAVEEAKKSIEDLRDLALETVENAIRAVEALAYSSRGGRIAEADLREILKLSDQAVTMAETFDLGNLAEVAKSLCDVADGLLANKLNDAAPILVHVQSMRLVAPGSPELGAEHIAHVLSELTRVRTHFHFSPLSAGPEPAPGPEIAG
ncbi:MAG TPA: hypothetical protein VMH86_12110 [Rhizomicrobium sp.]|nr:hypothetical protein [Rhizomicrobium sp.]